MDISGKQRTQWAIGLWYPFGLGRLAAAQALAEPLLGGMGAAEGAGLGGAAAAGLGALEGAEAEVMGGTE